MKRTRNHEFVSDMITVCSGFMDADSARRGVRALCRVFGGQLLYVPVSKTDGKAAERIRGVLADEIGGADAEKMLERLMTFYGGLQVYIPQETSGFARDIMLEIYEKYDGTKDSMNALCVEYGVTYTYVYNCIHTVRETKQRERQQGLFHQENGG